jgi:hypothetical protein
MITGLKNINESKNYRIKQMILTSFENEGCIEVIKNFNLSPKVLDKLFPKGISEIHFRMTKCSTFHELILGFLKSGYLKNEISVEYNNRPYTFSFFINDNMESLYIDILDVNYNDTISIYATPFYDGYCGIPIDVDSYTDNDDLGAHEPDDHISNYINLDEKKFKLFSDITNWFNNQYPKIILEEINHLWDKFRNSSI